MEYWFNLFQERPKSVPYELAIKNYRAVVTTSDSYDSYAQQVRYFIGIKAKGRISNRMFQENKARQIFQKTNISYHLIHVRVRVRNEGKKCSFFGKFGVLCFLETPVLRFVLLPYYQQFVM